MYAAKDAGGNPKSVPAHEKVDEAAKFMQQAVTDLTLTLEKAGGEAGLISGKNIITNFYLGVCVYVYEVYNIMACVAGHVLLGF